MFSIDFSKYRLVDLSLTIDPENQPEGRPFEVERGFLPDGTFKHNIQTHTHVGTHVEFPAHFFDGGKDATAFDVDRFVGPAALIELNMPPSHDAWVTAEVLEEGVGSVIKPGWMLVIRNSNTETRRAIATDEESASCLNEEAAEWMRDRKINALGYNFPFVDLGRSIKQARNVHDILLGADICMIDFMDNLDALTRQIFYLICLPIKVKNLDSTLVRPLAIEEI